MSVPCRSDTSARRPGAVLSGVHSAALTVAIEAVDEWHEVGIAHDVLEGVAADAWLAPCSTALAAVRAADQTVNKAAAVLSARVHQAVRGLETEWLNADVCSVGSSLSPVVLALWWWDEKCLVVAAKTGTIQAQL